MRRLTLLAFSVPIAVCLTGCAYWRTPVMPPKGILITQHSAPLSTNFSDTPVCTKEGSASTFYLHDFILTGMNYAWDRADIERAARMGNLSKVEYADYSMLLVLGLFGKFTVTAYGQ